MSFYPKLNCEHSREDIKMKKIIAPVEYQFLMTIHFRSVTRYVIVIKGGYSQVESKCLVPILPGKFKSQRQSSSLNKSRTK